jgi:hypothetical protein
MSILNRNILNRAYPKRSMIQGYSIEDIIECCLGYLKNKVGIGLPVPHFLGGWKGLAQLGGKSSSTRI